MINDMHEEEKEENLTSFILSHSMPGFTLISSLFLSILPVDARSDSPTLL